MNKLLACLVAVAFISITAGESQAQYYRGGGSGFSIGVGGVNGGFGYSNFRGPYGRSVSGFSVNVGNPGFYGGGFGVPVHRGFYGGGFPVYGRPVYARPVIYPVVPVYRGGFYGGYRGCGW